MTEHQADIASDSQAGTSPHVPLSARSTQMRLWGVLLILVIVFSLTAPGFFGFRNLIIVLVNSIPLALVAVGQLYVILTRGIDLSVGALVGFSSVVAAIAISTLTDMRIPPILAIFVGTGVGLSVAIVPGMVNGLVVAIGKIPPFIATISMFGIVRSLALLITNRQSTIVILPEPVRNILRGISNGSIIYYVPDYGLAFFRQPTDLMPVQVQGILRLLPYLLLFGGGVIFGFGYLLANTNFGLYTYAIGTNSTVVRRSGFNVTLHLILIYVLSAFAASLAGVLNVYRTLAGSTEVSETLLFGSIAAVLIGGGRLSGGVGTVRGTVLAVVVLATLQTGLAYWGLNAQWYRIILGALILTVVLWQRLQVDENNDHQL